MSWRRISGVFLRYFYIATGISQLADLFYWPLIDIFLWGLTTTWIQQHESASNVALVLMTGLIFWQIAWRGNYEISVNLLQEFWNRNLVNLFATPLTVVEWAIGVVLLGFLKIAVSLAFGSLVVYILYTLNVFTVGWAFLPYAASLMFFGWTIGLLASSLIIYWGQKVDMLAWMTAYLFAPFSAVFYPVSVLPGWMAKIAWALPTTYIFEGMRSILAGHDFPVRSFVMSIVLNIVYFCLALSFFNWMYKKSREKGLARLE